MSERREIAKKESPINESINFGRKCEIAKYLRWEGRGGGWDVWSSCMHD